MADGLDEDKEVRLSSYEVYEDIGTFDNDWMRSIVPEIIR